MAEFATLADVKEHTNVTAAASDAELTLMLDAAEDVVRSLVGSFAPTTVTERVTVVGGTVILSRSPSGPVTLTTADGTALTGFEENRTAGLLYDVPTYNGRTATASYPAGGGIVPASVTLATAIITEHLFETQRRPGFTSGTPAGFGGVDGVPDAGISNRTGFAIPHRAEELLRPWMRSSVIA
jgi:hypothetical protein